MKITGLKKAVGDYQRERIAMEEKYEIMFNRKVYRVGSGYQYEETIERNGTGCTKEAFGLMKDEELFGWYKEWISDMEILEDYIDGDEWAIVQANLVNVDGDIIASREISDWQFLQRLEEK